MYTKQAFRDLDPDLIIQVTPLCYPPPPHSTLCARIAKMLADDFPHHLVDSERGVIAINSRKYITALSG